jgi:hypothetical protein
MLFTFTYVCLSTGLLQAAAGDSFLQKSSSQNETLLASLEAAFGPGSLEQRAYKLEGLLKSTFLSLPKKDSHSRISHAAARYALHRILLAHHGWSISGLEPNATTFNTTSLVGSGILKDLVPAHIEEVFEAHVGIDGFGLKDLALLAATIEHLVHADQKLVLLKVCELFDLPVVGDMSEDEMRSLILYYKALFLVAGSAHVQFDSVSAPQLKKYLRTAERGYPGWEDTVMFLDDERQSLAFADRSQANPFKKLQGSLQLALRVVERAADDFAVRIAEPECQEIKDDLLDYERGDTGRIRLADFYRAGLDSRFFFLESKEYLEAVGALDTSDSSVGPKVIVSNYVLAKSNCLASGHTYSICCINECEGVYGKLERGVAGTDASPQLIAHLVSGMSTSTVQGPRNLSRPLLLRLEEIADGNAGIIALHSRLFAQWMHQAFPRECPYPHLTGTTTTLSPRKWAAHNDMAYRIDVSVDKVRVPKNDAMHRAIKALDTQFVLGETDAEAIDMADGELMWTTEDEHFVTPTRSLVERLSSAVGNCLAPLMLLGVAVFAKHVWPVYRNQKGASSDCVFV